jgi:hypothetical protein
MPIRILRLFEPNSHETNRRSLILLDISPCALSSSLLSNRKALGLGGEEGNNGIGSKADHHISFRLFGIFHPSHKQKA